MERETITNKVCFEKKVAIPLLFPLLLTRAIAIYLFILLTVLKLYLRMAETVAGLVQAAVDVVNLVITLKDRYFSTKFASEKVWYYIKRITALLRLQNWPLINFACHHFNVPAAYDSTKDFTPHLQLIDSWLTHIGCKHQSSPKFSVIAEVRAFAATLQDQAHLRKQTEAISGWKTLLPVR